MTDRELLELAAKAAGIDGWWSGADYCYGYNGNKNVPVPWRPLTDDGDALRLAVTCKLAVHVWHDEDSVSVAKTLPFGFAPPDNDTAWSFHSAHAFNDDLNAAVRYAITRAAAEIGKAMP